MQRNHLRLSLAFVILSLFTLPAMAANPPQAAPALSAVDQAFIASLAIPGAPTPAARPPQSGTKALCSAAASCNDGTIVSCTGNNSTTSCSGSDRNCAVGERGHVTCDGNTTVCPTPCPVDCDQLEQDCAWTCNPCNYNFSCNPDTGFHSCHCIFRTCPI